MFFLFVCLVKWRYKLLLLVWIILSTYRGTWRSLEQRAQYMWWHVTPLPEPTRQDTHYLEDIPQEGINAIDIVLERQVKCLLLLSFQNSLQNKEMVPSHSIKLMDGGLFLFSATVNLWSCYMRPVHAAIFSVTQSSQDSFYVWEEGLSGVPDFSHAPAASTVTGYHTSNLELLLG